MREHPARNVDEIAFGLAYAIFRQQSARFICGRREFQCALGTGLIATRSSLSELATGSVRLLSADVVVVARILCDSFEQL